jgi:hypothetical protein
MVSKFFKKECCPDLEKFGSSIISPTAPQIEWISLEGSPITAVTKHQLLMKIDLAEGLCSTRNV